MKRYEVTAIKKPNRESSHEHITHIGNNDADWIMTREEAIRRIDSKLESFFTVDKISGQNAFVGVVREAGKNPYLRTYADGKWNNNLLSLPECNSSAKIVA